MSADVKPAPEGKPTETPTPAPVAAAPTVDPAKIEALEKRAAKADKLEKELSSLNERIKSPDFIKETLASALGLTKEEDPKAKFATLEAERNGFRSENARLKAERVISKAARQFDAHDEDDHFDAALKFGVLGEDGSVDTDKVTEFFTKQKASKAYLFKAPAAPAEKGPPGGATKTPPSPAQPAPSQPASAPPADFDAWVHTIRPN
jgi:hypothetical protein